MPLFGEIHHPRGIDLSEPLTAHLRSGLRAEPAASFERGHHMTRQQFQCFAIVLDNARDEHLHANVLVTPDQVNRLRHGHGEAAELFRDAVGVRFFWRAISSTAISTLVRFVLSISP